MHQYANVYLTLDDVENKNPFINRKPNFNELPDFQLSKDRLPEPIWDSQPDYIKAYYKAWEIAFSNLGKPTEKNGFVSPYIDAAFSGDIFMWDSCFMLMFGKYGDNVFNFQSTLDDFYCKQEPDGFICRQISEETGKGKFFRHDPVSTGPEILAWCEWQYYQNYGDKERLRDVYYPLLCYHRWLKTYRRWKDGSYWSSGYGCGMDNMPRHDLSNVSCQEDWRLECYFHSFLSWIDANCQAVLSCKELIKIAKELGIEDGVEELTQEIEFLTKFINEKMWNEEDKFYYDLRFDDSHLKVKTVAGYWALLADIVPESKRADFIAHLENEKEFNRPHRVPTLSADHPDYDPEGGYWNGSIWAPTNYMILAGLSRFGKDDLAYEIAKNHYENMLEVYRKTGTFWENYAPESANRGNASRADFVGWSGIIPITVFIEYILGIKVAAEKKEIVWRVNSLDRHGIKKLPVGKGITANLICEARKSESDKPEITVECSEKIKVKVIYDNGKSFEI